MQDRSGLIINDLDGAVAISGPDLGSVMIVAVVIAVATGVVVNGQHTIGSRRIVISGEADKAPVVQLSDRLGAGVDHIDPIEGPIGKKVRTERRVDPTDVT
jgi:hypothetical protein